MGLKGGLWLLARIQIEFMVLLFVLLFFLCFVGLLGIEGSAILR